MRKGKKTLVILAIVAMVFTMIPMQLFAAPAANTYDRIGGTTQYDTAAQIATTGWAGGASTAIIAVGTVGNSYDALAAGPLAEKKNAPILLTEGARLTAVTQSALQSLGVKNVIIVGGTGVVKQSVEDAIKALGISTSRLAGADAAETSVKVAQQVGASSAIVLAGGKGQDALSVASIAAAKGYPILYTNKASNLPDSVANYVAAQSGVGTSYVIGGTGVISAAEAAQLPGTIVRYGGLDAYDTNLAVIQGLADGIDFSKVYVANGQAMVDALAGAPLAAASDSAIVLTDNSRIPAAQYISTQLSAGSAVIALGGAAAVSDSILHQISYSAPVETEYTLTAGNYIAGVDIPCGVCNVAAVSGQGNLFSSNLSDGGINEMFGIDDGSGLYTDHFDNLQLPEGTMLSLNSRLTVTLTYTKVTSDYTGRVYDDESAIELDSGNYTAGKDFSAGVYKIVAVSGQGNLSSSNLFDGGVNEIFGIDDGSNFYNNQFVNAVLPQGVELTVSGGLTIKLIPAQ